MKKITWVILFQLVSLNLILGQSFEKANLKNDELLSHLVSAGNISGLAVAVYHKDKLIWSKEYGVSNFEYNVPVSDSSKFRIASISKLFTGTVLLKLHNSGKLNLDDKISTHLDSLPLAWEYITIRQIAQHTSGIGHYIDMEDALDVRHYESSAEAMMKFKNRPMNHPPDADVTYSSYAYTILAAIIEKVTGKDFHYALKEIIFKPLGMNFTELDHQRTIVKGRTGFYQYNNNREPENSPYINLSGRWAGSGYLSTAKDLAMFGAAHTGISTFFTKKDLSTLTSPRVINDSLKTKEGLGWGLRFGYNKNKMFWGDGSTSGSKCGLLVYPEQNLSIAIVSNMRGAPIERGEFQILATRLIANIKGDKIKEISETDTGKYNLDIEIGENLYNGKLILSKKDEDESYINFHGIQIFPIKDAFWVNNELWIFGIGGGTGAITTGILPLKIKLNKEKVSGQIYRINAKINGEKISATTNKD